MPPKRKLDNIAISQNVHESRHFQVYGNNPKPSKKRRLQEPTSYIKKPSPSSINAIKKKLRDVNRRLSRSETISAEIRVEYERARDAYHLELNAITAEKLRQRMIKKYHMVRFFERQKASRILKRIRKLMLTENSTDEEHSLEAKLHEAEVDLNYTLYHPLSETYISLYPRNKPSEEESKSNLDTTKKKPPVWYEIEKAMINGSLEKIRNRTPAIQVSLSKAPNKSKTKKTSQGHAENYTGLNHQKKSKPIEVKTENKTALASKPYKSHNTQHVPDDKNGDSDGDFFE
ncbi:rRNA-processing protein efg1 [Erysiphe neolycopersici]|uniref:rRNA-processing protein EFG1 n=1 Tax=Erysiphe neolycopersici TaxID=212602 RepID=A0A420HDI9_9PEZI|nr:rRNA-processing protein efg1 [Erysiphe neolycopersici]